MKRSIICASFAGVCLFPYLVISANGQPEDKALRERVLSEYPRALEALRAHLSKGSGVVVRSVERGIGTNRHRLTVGRTVFESKRPGMARVVSDTDSTRDSEKGATSKHTQTVYCYNRDYSFKLSREGGSSAYSIASFEKNVNGKSPMETREMGLRLSMYLDAPTGLYVFPISSILADPRFSLERVSQAVEKNKQLVKIEFNVKADGQREGYKAWLLVSPAEAWTLYAYDMRTDRNKDHVYGTLEYGEPLRGFATPKRVVHVRDKRGGTTPTEIQTYDIEEIRFVDVPESDFTLAAFGLPDVQQPGKRSYASQTGFWFLTLSILSLVIAVLFKLTSSILKRKNAHNEHTSMRSASDTAH